MNHRGMKDAWFGEIFHFRESVDENFRDLPINNPVTTLRLKFAHVAAGAAGFARANMLCLSILTSRPLWGTIIFIYVYLSRLCVMCKVHIQLN
jgi:hypothetical protein